MHVEQWMKKTTTNDSTPSHALRRQPPFHARRLIAALAPADAKSCLPLTLRPATRGRLLLATGAVDEVVLVPALVRLEPVFAGPFIPDARLVPNVPTVPDTL